MSYILDALRKSTAETNPAVAASLLQGDARNHKQRRIGITILLVLLTNAVVLGWLVWPEHFEWANATQSILAPDATRNTTTRTFEQAANPVAQKPTASAAAVTATASKSEPKPIIAIVLEDLPAPARLAFPELEFSTHVYAEDPGLRAIVANGRRLTQGDSIEGLKLQEITQEGVVFLYQHYRVTISVLALWDEDN